jgi:hypothetical protein
MSDANGTPFHPLRTLEEAQQRDHGIAIRQRDWGGQIYAVIPVQMIRCSTDWQHRLLLDLYTEPMVVRRERRCVDLVLEGLLRQISPSWFGVTDRPACK